MSQWTTNNITNLEGKVIIITGGNSGLGFESAKALCEKNAEVILACRSREKTNNAVQEILSIQPKAKVSGLSLDLQDLASIDAFSTNFSKKFSQLDVLMNNAGIMNTPYSLTKDGFESQLGTNHFGHFALTANLLSILNNTPGSRVVTVSSAGHRAGTMNFKDLMFNDGKDYSAIKAYGRSKLANLLFAYELQRRFDQHNIDCKSIAAHPGASQTNLGRHIEDALVFKIFNPILSRIIQQADQGALPQLRASVDTRLRGGEFFGPDGIFEMSGHPILVQSNKASHNKTDAKALWTISERLTNRKFEF